MSAYLGLLPLGVAAAITVLALLAAVDGRVEGFLTRVARATFGRYVTGEARDRQRLLRAAYVEETYRVYAAKTYLYAAMFAFVGGIVGVYLVGGALVLLPGAGRATSQLPSTMVGLFGNPELVPVFSPQQVLLLVLVGGTFGGVVGAGSAYSLRWRLPEGRAEARRRGINESLARTVAFVYALSRGGMAFPEAIRTLARNREVYGEAADELTVAVREMDVFGTDMITAIRRTARRSPSDEFKTFSENLASVLQSGQSLPDFLSEQYERFREETEDRQAEVLEMLATTAEVYVTLLVAGTLFLITILLVFGLTTANTLWIIRMLAYVAVPLANFGFILYLAQKLELLGVSRTNPGVAEDSKGSPVAQSAVEARRADGGHVEAVEENLARLAVYDRLESIRTAIGHPFRTILDRPTLLLLVTVPLALLLVVTRMPTVLSGAGIRVRVLDDVLVQAALLVLGSFAVVWELHSRRIDRIEAATPELLERLASLNEAGMTVITSFDRVRDTDLGELTGEVQRVWADVELGANLDDALRRFGRRLHTTSTSRAVTLLTNAMRASGKIGPVLRIAAVQARADLRLRRQRRQQMLTYLVVIYVSFLVFLVIIIAVQAVLVPSLPNTVPTPTNTGELGVNADQFARLGGVDKAAYTLVFFHTALVQALLSGFVAGQLGEGTLKDGAKHATILLGLAYVAFLLLSVPTASLAIADQSVADDTVVVESASLSEGGYVVLHAESADGPVVGRSEYLAPGRTENVEVALDAPPDQQIELVAVPHLDTDGDRAYEYADGRVDRPYPSDRFRTTDAASVTPA